MLTWKKQHAARALALLFIFLVVPGYLSATSTEKSKRPAHEAINKNDATRAWADFQSKILNKDYQAAAEYIYPRYRQRFGNSPYKKWYFGAGADSLVLKKLDVQGNYADLCYSAFYRGSPYDIKYSLIKEAGRTYFTYQAHAMTLDWDRRESDHFVFIFDKDKRNAPFGITYPTDLAVRLMEEHYDRIATLLGIAVEDKIEVYISNSVEETARLAGEAEKAEALSQPILNVVISPFPFSVMHEVTHVLAYIYLQRNDMKVSDFLSHGLVEYGDGNGGSWKGYQATAWMKKNLEDGTFKPLREIDDYPETASLTQFLIEEYGAKKYRQLLVEATDNEHFMQSLKDIYGLSLDELEREWIEWIKKSQVTMDPMDTRTVEFRILTDPWDRKSVGRYTIWVDTQQRMPSEKEVARVETLYVNECRKRSIAPLPHISFYLANSRNRMLELFHSPDDYYRDGNVMADTTFINSKAFLDEE
jgi:hypothetical protein